MSWPEDLYRGIPIRRAETWPEYLRRREDERRWLTYDEKNALLAIAKAGVRALPTKKGARHA